MAKEAAPLKPSAWTSADAWKPPSSGVLPGDLSPRSLSQEDLLQNSAPHGGTTHQGLRLRIVQVWPPFKNASFPSVSSWCLFLKEEAVRIRLAAAPTPSQRETPGRSSEPHGCSGGSSKYQKCWGLAAHLAGWVGRGRGALVPAHPTPPPAPAPAILLN